VYLQRLPQSIVLTVEDDGCGFDPDTIGPGNTGGLGLLGIRERVAGFRGTFRLDSREGSGTRVSVELPAMIASAQTQKEGEPAHGADSARG
jgi:signal transduction histidine kinase